MKVSREEIERHRTTNGGFTRDTLAAWGVSWPPPKGWMARLMGAPEDFVLPSDLRYFILKRDSGRCVLCGRSAKDGAKLQPDHIKPRSLYPELALDPNNLQTLCSSCNIGKGNRDETNWKAA